MSPLVFTCLAFDFLVFLLLDLFLSLLDVIDQVKHHDVWKVIGLDCQPGFHVIVVPERLCKLRVVDFYTVFTVGRVLKRLLDLLP